MSISQGQFLSRDNNRLLQGILDRQSITFSQASQNAFTLARDQANLQATQGRDLLGVQARDRDFRENRFRDRRNFSEEVFRDERNFNQRDSQFDQTHAESVRRTNILDSNTDAARAQSRELGLAGLDLQERRLAIDEEKFNSEKRLTDLRLTRAADDLGASDALLPRLREGVAAGDLGVIRDVKLEGQSRGLQGITAAATGAEKFITGEEEKAIVGDSVITAEENLEEARRLREAGDLFTSRQLIARAIGGLEGVKGSEGILREAEEFKSIITAESEVAIKESLSSKSARESVDLYTKNAGLASKGAFSGQYSYEDEVGFVLDAVSREAYVTGNSGTAVASDVTDSASIREIRGKFYDSVVNSSQEARDASRSKVDVNFRYLKDFIKK